MGKNLKRVILQVPERFLKAFDEEIEGIYASRNEAIRAGMIMVLESIKAERASQTLIRRRMVQAFQADAP